MSKTFESYHDFALAKEEGKKKKLDAAYICCTLSDNEAYRTHLKLTNKVTHGKRPPYCLFASRMSGFEGFVLALSVEISTIGSLAKHSFYTDQKSFYKPFAAA